MYFAYVDDAGDAGLVRSPTEHLVLAVVLVEQRSWLRGLDALIELRERLFRRYGLPRRKRIRATDLLRGGGSIRPLLLPTRERGKLLKGIFRYQKETLPIRVFGVCLHKESAAEKGLDPWETVWTVLLERLQRFCEAEDDHFTVVTERELAEQSQKLTRSLRRHHRISLLGGEGSKRVDLRRMLEDPLAAKPTESYWLQVSDWIAHALLRSEHVEPKGPWSRGLWDQLGDLHVREVNKLRGGPPGIVMIP